MCIPDARGWHDRVSYVSETRRVGMTEFHMYPKLAGLVRMEIICIRDAQDCHDRVSYVSQTPGVDMNGDHMYPEHNTLSFIKFLILSSFFQKERFYI